MKHLAGVSLWRTVSLTLFALILAVAFLQPTATDPDLRIEAPRIAASAALFLIAVALVPLLIRPIKVPRSRWLPLVTAVLSGALVAVPVVLNALGRYGAAGSIFRALHVVTGERNFGDLELPLVWRLCSRRGSDVFFDLTCVQQNIASAPQHVMDYGPGWLWFPFIAVPPSWSLGLGLVMLMLTSVSLWWLSRASLGRGQITLLIGSLGASWLLLLERANIDAVLIWFAVLFAIVLRRTSGLTPWIIAAVAIWLLGTWKYYPFALGLLLLPATRRPRGWWVLGAFAVATIAYVVTALDRFTQAFSDNADRSSLVGSGLGRDSIARLMSGSPEAPPWAVGVVLLAALAAAVWGFTTARNSRPVPFANSALAFAGASMVAVPVIASGFGYQYKVALLILVVPALSQLRRRSSPVVWQSSTFALIATTAALVGLWGNTFTWSVLTVAATSFALGVGTHGIFRATFVEDGRDRGTSQASCEVAAHS